MNSYCVSNFKSELRFHSDYEHREEGSSNGSESDESLLCSTSVYPKDRYKFVLVTFFLMGVATLLPWNFFVTANDYWMYKFRNVSSGYDPNDKTPLQSAFTSYLAITNYLPFITLLFVNAVVSHKISEKKRIGGSLFAMFIIFTTTIAFVKINTDGWQMTFFAITMVFVFFISAACAIFQGGVSGLASLLPTKYMHAMMTGQAIAGIFASIAQILSLVQRSHPTNSALGYFIFAVVLLKIVTVFYTRIHKSPFCQVFLMERDNQEEKPPMIENLPLNSISAILLILRKIWIHGLSVLIVFWVTLSIFPAMCVLVVSEQYQRGSSLSGVYFLPVCCFLLFNLSDFTGRTISKWIPLRRSWKWQTLALSCLRIVFIPLFMLCNCQPRRHLPVMFGDAVYVFLVVTMGLTNGYLATVAMMFGPLNTKREFREVAGFIMVALMGSGLTFGSITSYPLLKLL